MTPHGGGFPGLAVDVKAMLSSLADKLAALTFKMPNLTLRLALEPTTIF